MSGMIFPKGVTMGDVGRATAESEWKAALCD